MQNTIQFTTTNTKRNLLPLTRCRCLRAILQYLREWQSNAIPVLHNNTLSHTTSITIGVVHISLPPTLRDLNQNGDDQVSNWFLQRSFLSTTRQFAFVIRYVFHIFFSYIIPFVVCILFGQATPICVEPQRQSRSKDTLGDDLALSVPSNLSLI